MKIAVTRADGNTELLLLNGPVTIHEGGQYQSHIHSAEGFDHYFQPDGYYDGWGLGCPDNSCWTKEQAQTYIKAAQDERRIVPLTFARFAWLKLRDMRRRAVFWKVVLLRLPGYPNWRELF